MIQEYRHINFSIVRVMQYTLFTMILQESERTVDHESFAKLSDGDCSSQVVHVFIATRREREYSRIHVFAS